MYTPSKSELLKLALACTISLNVVLGLGVVTAFHVGYEAGVKDGVNTGVQLAGSDDDSSSNSNLVSSDWNSQEPTTPEPEPTTSEPNETVLEPKHNPAAGVTFDEHIASTMGRAVTVQAVSMEHADALYIKTTEGDCSTCAIRSVGDSITVLGVEDGTKISVVAALDDRETVIQTYVVTE